MSEKEEDVVTRLNIDSHAHKRIDDLIKRIEMLEKAIENKNDVR